MKFNKKFLKWKRREISKYNLGVLVVNKNLFKSPLRGSFPSQHEGYDSSIITNDVSLLKLDEPLEFNE